MRLRVPFVYRHELRSTLWSRAVLAVVVLSALASVSAVVSVESTTTTFPIMGSAVYYYDGGAYHITGWAYDAAGAPVGGVAAEFNEITTGSQNNSSGPYSTISNNQGEFSLTIPAPNVAGSGLAVASVRLESSRAVNVLWGGIFSSAAQFVLGYIAPGTAGSILGLVAVGTDYYSAHTQVMVFAGGSNGSAPKGLRLETCWTPQALGPPPFGPFPQFNCNGRPTRELGQISGLWSHFSLPVYPVNASAVIVQLVNGTNGIVDSITLTPTPTLDDTTSVINNAPGAPVLNAFALAASFFLPFMAVVAAYWAYARPRLSGAMEPVLARPITRGGVFLARYLGIALALVVASVTAILVLDASVEGILGEPLPVGFLAPLMGGALVAALGVAGFVFLGAHLVRTEGGALGIGITLLTLGFFWPDVALGILVLNNPAFGSSVASTFLLRSQLFLPSQFPGLATSLLTGLTPFGNPLGASAGGVSLALQAVCGVAWIVVPFVLTYVLVVKRD